MSVLERGITALPVPQDDASVVQIDKLQGAEKPFPHPNPSPGQEVALGARLSSRHLLQSRRIPSALLGAARIRSRRSTLAACVRRLTLVLTLTGRFETRGENVHQKKKKTVQFVSNHLQQFERNFEYFEQYSRRNMGEKKDNPCIFFCCPGTTCWKPDPGTSTAWCATLARMRRATQKNVRAKTASSTPLAASPWVFFFFVILSPLLPTPMPARPRSLLD